MQELISQNGKILKKQKKSDNKNEIKKIKREAMETKNAKQMYKISLHCWPWVKK